MERMGAFLCLGAAWVRFMALEASLAVGGFEPEQPDFIDAILNRTGAGLGSRSTGTFKVLFILK
jgi:hypothetical protein